MVTIAGFSTYLKDLTLNLIFRDGSYTQPGTLYVALYSVMPADDGTGGTELSAGNYARVGIATTNAAWDAPFAGTGNERRIQNTAAVNFGTASADWAPSGTPCVGFGLRDASTGAGNYFGGNTFASSVIIQTGNPVQFNAGELDVVLSGS